MKALVLVLCAALPVTALGEGLDEALQAAMGQSFFDLPWVQAPASTRARDGLGPLFNARACSTCHRGGAGGSPPRAGSDNPALVMQLVGADPAYGTQLQPLGAGIPGEGVLRVRYRPLTIRLHDGGTVSLNAPTYTLKRLNHGELDPATSLSPRLAPPLHGVGRLAAVPETAILALVDPDDGDGDGISGRARWVTDRLDGARRVGRFGLKADHPDLAHQVAAAFSADMGLTSRYYPDTTCAPRQTECRGRPDGANRVGEPEVSDTILAAVTAFIARRPPPRGRLSEPGFKLFADLGCARCHVPRLPASDGTDVAAFTDLLLHDLGPGLADDAGGEWRTAPLWGLGQRLADTRGAAFLHDGRARSLTEAVLWHDGEARAAAAGFRRLPADERASLLRFLEAL